MELSPQLLLSAYCQGVFPMADEDGDIYWYDPDPRAILPLKSFHVSRSLQKKVRQARFEIRINSSFSAIIQACALHGPDREETWISTEIIESYKMLHQLGFAHSVETWFDDELVGGLYGVAVNGMFAGESMFSTIRDASKIALVYLVNYLRERGFILLDVQFMTDHLRRFGAIEVSRAEYHERLAHAIKLPVSFL
jgi:leucyl/phenylalanyl-tRNA--protein transferase